jgi:hypothetical protein
MVVICCLKKREKEMEKKKSIKCFCFLKKVHWVAAEAIDSGTTVDDS